MSSEKTREWDHFTEKEMDYFERQYFEPYRSTIAFSEWLERKDCLNASKKAKVLDIGAGMGEATQFLAQRFSNANFTGLELSRHLVEKGNAALRSTERTNALLIEGDIFKLREKEFGPLDGIISMQTLSWLPEFKTPIEKMISLGPRWIALTSLFYDGPVNAKIEIQDLTSSTAERPYRESFYNVYSIPLVKELFFDHGYTDFHYDPFVIDIDLKKPSNGGMGTYTERLADEKRIQVSGPVLMSWYFILAKKKKN